MTFETPLRLVPNADDQPGEDEAGDLSDEAKLALTDPDEGEQVLRRLLWLNHGCPISALYKDDGEMQCGECRIDFKRDDPQSILNRFNEIGEERWREHADDQPGEDGVGETGWAQFYDYEAEVEGGDTLAIHTDGHKDGGFGISDPDILRDLRSMIDVILREENDA